MSLAWILNIYSKAAGYARALVVILSSLLVFLTAAGPLANVPIVAKIAAAVAALIELLTRFTGAGNKPPTITPNAPGVIPQA